ncbi:Shikimate kinase [Penicillium cf. griseofulvum]|uniref:Gluconokinase n=1 Tax=Penicillium cf. griseofulvum TaxID=2972120 RepID=A0A9W9MR78_9EURO|nr:Shikimate kinase [Penicillium cf. griseofulvum]KAJ5448978.1 Shikimate kinase [Penicillium cf. griseofulvum]
MLSAGERPQPSHASTIDSTVSKARIMPDLATNGSNGAASSNSSQLQHIWVVTGPAGCGKSTVGNVLRTELGIPFLEGDDFHPIANKDKMGKGIPLTDEDRWDWLISLRQAAIDVLSPSETNNFHPPAGVVVACSALKQKYRDVMRVAAYGSSSVQIHFVYLKLSEAVLLQRVTQRQSHYMKSSMVQSQLAVLEEPMGEWDAITVNVEGTMEDVQRNVIDAVTEKLAEYK